MLSLLKNLVPNTEVPLTAFRSAVNCVLSPPPCLVKFMYVPSSTVTRPVFLTTAFPPVRVTPIPVPAVTLSDPTSTHPGLPLPSLSATYCFKESAEVLKYI